MEEIQQGSQKDSEFIKKKLIEYNMQQLPDEIKTPIEQLSFIIRNKVGVIVGGITATTFWSHVHIDFLWVDEKHRGKRYGSKLIKKMEEWAMRKGCRTILLDTFSFQAPEFYKKQGFTVIGIVEDHPRGYNQYFLEKKMEGNNI
ncbi:GNAT family N-acetyltransferase [Aquibacillus rhizosphaerae]|uniref:GNAT family N-acetyltransferase n=1 Tax=Aquibacillus rhizosphaerae TaxID=3051431 RepID=A0ABT7LAY1_9BACI|nr:GNAT family N-acetyltransferase [Aquibacillus sp. LR5S19]MDL4843018.1 GNAT family N-acetyltransferase [Aquibacillus sp. LR5S19]